MTYDKVIIGAGLYGLYALQHCAARGEKVLVVERDDVPFARATYINQARVHMGYHYPRSYSTAIKSAHYFRRFMEDYSYCVMREFDQVYATSAHFSWTNAPEFRHFCAAAGIRCDDVSPTKYFNEGMCDGAYLTEEYTYDAQILKEHMLADIAKLPTAEIRCNTQPVEITKGTTTYTLKLSDGTTVETPFLLNATYAGVNQILHMMGLEPFKIKYELCEIILCSVSEELKNTGLTVMDGPFFSIMPFGKTGLHSLTSVTFTPHITSYDALPTFECQARSGGYCTPESMGNCDYCRAKPQSAWPLMSSLARKYMKPEYGFEYKSSLYSMKPILKASEIDDSRPTVIRQYSSAPTFVSVLSGKINTVYDLDEVLDNG